MGKIKEYQTTKEHCQKMINDNNRPICSGCGGKIEPIETVDNSGNPTYWSGCMKCQMFNNGTIIKNYMIAKKMVLEYNYRAYPWDEEPDKKNDLDKYIYWLHGQIKGTVSVVEKILYLNHKQEINNL